MIAIQGDQLSVLRKELLPETVSTLTSMIEVLTYGRFQANEIASISTALLNTYYYFRLGEIAYFLHKGSMGMYGNVPSGANPVLYWAQQYDINERTNYFRSEALKHKEGFEKENYLNERQEAKKLNEMTKESFKRLQANQDAKKKLDAKNNG